MAYTEGSRVYFATKKETVYNTEESGTGGKILRRVTGTLDLTKPEVASAEKRDDFQEVDVNHGTRSVNFALNGEMFGGDYEEFIAACLRRDFTSVTTVAAGAGAGFSIASGVLSRADSAESFLDDGLTQGQVIRLTGMTATGNNNRNMRIVSEVAPAHFTLVAVDGGAAVANSADSTTATIVIPGQVTYIPLTNHTSDTFTIERHDRATDISDIARGCKVGQMDLSVQPDTPIGFNFSGMGVDRRTLGDSSAPVLTSPTAAGTGPSMSAAVGYARINGVVQAVITGFNLTVNTGLQNKPVAFANVTPDVFYGRAAQVTGTVNALKQNALLSDLFDDETECSLEFIVEAPGSNPKSFVSIFMPRVKFMSAGQDDPDGPAVQTLNFRSLRPKAGNGIPLSALYIQDSSVV